MAPWARRALAAVLVCVPIASRAAETTAPPMPLAAFTVEIERLGQLAQSCAAAATACDPAKAPERQKVQESSARSFVMNWGWLRDALQAAQRNQSPADRLRSMEAVQAHLRELARAADETTSGSSAEFGRAKAAASEALRREEFRTAEGPGWLERKLARLEDWFLRLFDGAGRFGRKAPWLAPLIEWGCFALAASGLLFSLQRNLRRQALRISLTEGLPLRGVARTSSEDLQRRAEGQAAAGDWREAIHSLFWAAVVFLGSRRLWRVDPARTPREYLSLLKPASEAREAFRSLMGLLERSWYGHGETTEMEYREAAALLERLRQASRDHALSPQTTHRVAETA